MFISPILIFILHLALRGQEKEFLQGGLVSGNSRPPQRMPKCGGTPKFSKPPQESRRFIFCGLCTRKGYETHLILLPSSFLSFFLSFFLLLLLLGVEVFYSKRRGSWRKASEPPPFLCRETRLGSFWPLPGQKGHPVLESQHGGPSLEQP